MARTPRIGILTGGGDVPGLNSVIKSVVYRATELGYEVYGLRRGWERLTHMKPGPGLDTDYVVPLGKAAITHPGSHITVIAYGPAKGITRSISSTRKYASTSTTHASRCARNIP